jgi:LacI family transcriptional regulator
VATIKDVSKLSGFSVATVSRVINQSGYVNHATETAIRSAMEALNYKPSEMARTLAGKNSSTIALIVPDILNPFFPELARSIEDAAYELGYTVILCNSDNDPKKEENYFRVLESKRIDGIIISSYTIRPHQILELQKKSIPVVLIDSQYPSSSIVSYISKNREGAHMAVNHLIEQGCRSIAHICGPMDVYSARERAMGYEEVCREQGIFSPSLFAQGDFHVDGGYEATLGLLKTRPDIDGIFAGNDLMAAGACKAIIELGKSVPGDIKIIGFDGIALTTTVPTLSTIAQPIFQMGKAAIQSLMKLIQKESVDCVVNELDVELIVRQSTSK